MESFYKTHNYLVEKVQSPVRRQLMDEIDWNHRLIGIKGSRGVGKTTFLLQYAKENFGSDRCCLYVNFNNFYFTQHSLVEFADDFCKQGGKTLLIDQTFKYENWSKELRECYERFPNLHIIFSGSSVMRLIEENPDLQDIVSVYNLRGFSFREYLNLKCGTDFKSLTLKEITQKSTTLSNEICTQIQPLDYFEDYLHHGFYPFFLENRNYSENLLKTMNMMLEVDILLIKQIELKYLSKIRKLLYIIMGDAPSAPNVSQLSVEIETSRATIMNYIKYLKDARLLNLLYSEGEEYPKKPKQLYVQNTNLMHAVYPEKVNREAEHKTFLYNALHARHKINKGRKNSDFLVDQELNFKLDNDTNHKPSAKTFYVTTEQNASGKNQIPLWLLGFLY
jgi:predicted AAA+ superfamily ATPase